MSYYTYIPPKAAASTPEAPTAPKYYYDYSKAPAPAPEAPKQPNCCYNFTTNGYTGHIPNAHAQTYTVITHPNQPIYQGQPPLCYPLAAAPAIEQPSAHHVWYGRTKEQVDAENIAIAQKVGTNKPVQLVPYNPSGEQQFWCRELDSSYTLRTSKDITENLQPGFWQYAQPGGYPYWYRMKK